MIIIKKDNVSTKQKMFVYICIALILSLFIYLRNEKINKTIADKLLFTQEIEEIILNSVNYLYNEDLEKIPYPEYFHDDSINNILDIYKNSNTTIKDSPFRMVAKKLTKDKIYNKRQHTKRLTIYDGQISFDIIDKTSNVKANTSTKNITVYLIQEKNSIKLVNIELNSINE